MPTVDELLRVLQPALEDPASVSLAVREFRDLYRRTDEGELAGRRCANAVLSALYETLAYYVDDPVWEAEDVAYFGRVRALHEIREAIARLREIEGAQD